MWHPQRAGSHPRPCDCMCECCCCAWGLHGGGDVLWTAGALSSCKAADMPRCETHVLVQERERTSSCGISGIQTCYSIACAERKVRSGACQASAEPLQLLWPLTATGHACLLDVCHALPVYICRCSKEAAHA